MPYSVEHLLENQGTVIVIQKTDTVTTALDLMIEHDFSQLPVVDENGRLQGMITYESIMRAARSFNATLDQLFVCDVIVDAPIHYREDDLFDLLDELKPTNAVVIIEPEGYVVGVVTSYDASRFLRNRTEDLMHVEDIEFIIKELIKRTYAVQKHASNATESDDTAMKPSAPRGKRSGAGNAKAFEELNLGDYINLLMSRDIWRFCAPILNVDKEPLYELLVWIRQTRNDLAHFRCEISPRSRQELKYCANWLRSRYRDYEKQQGGSVINSLLEQREEKEMPHTAREEPPAYQADAEDKKRSRIGKVRARSRYAALANWLAQQGEEQVLLTFGEIEQIIRSPLPASALQLRAWWSNDPEEHARALLWLEAGWRVTYVDLREEQVIFCKIESDVAG